MLNGLERQVNIFLLLADKASPVSNLLNSLEWLWLNKFLKNNALRAEREWNREKLAARGSA
jgi:hypothetical protein